MRFEVTRIRTCSRAVAASELKVRDRQVTIADVEAKALRSFEAQAEQALISHAGIAVVEERNNRVVGRWSVGRIRVNAASADTNAEIRLDRTATVQIDNAVQHHSVGVRIRAALNGRTSVDIIVTAAQFAFQTETVGERIAKRAGTKPIAAQAVGAAEIHRRRARSVNAISLKRAIKGIARINAAIPTFICERRAGDHNRRQGSRALKNLLHQSSPQLNLETAMHFACRLGASGTRSGSRIHRVSTPFFPAWRHPFSVIITLAL
jgi:hypothetical protein